MPVGTTSPTMVMDKIKTIVTTITGIGATRIFQGKKRFAEAENLENDTRALTAQTQGYFSYWINTCDEGPQTRCGDLLITGYLQVYIPSEVTSDLNSAYDLAEAVNEALSRESNWVTIGTRPKSIRFSEHEGDNLEDSVVEFIYALQFQLPISCGT